MVLLLCVCGANLSDASASLIGLLGRRSLESVTVRTILYPHPPEESLRQALVQWLPGVRAHGGHTRTRAHPTLRPRFTPSLMTLRAASYALAYYGVYRRVE